MISRLTPLNTGRRPFQLSKPSTKAHPLVWFLYTHMVTENFSWTEVADRAGVHRDTYRRWRTGQRMPRLRDIEACLEVIGYRIKPCPLLPEETLQAKGKKHNYA